MRTPWRSDWFLGWGRTEMSVHAIKYTVIKKIWGGMSWTQMPTWRGTHRWNRRQPALVVMNYWNKKGEFLFTTICLLQTSKSRKCAGNGISAFCNHYSKDWVRQQSLMDAKYRKKLVLREKNIWMVFKWFPADCLLASWRKKIFLHSSK